jgi:hypothetical protein
MSALAAWAAWTIARIPATSTKSRPVTSTGQISQEDRGGECGREDGVNCQVDLAAELPGAGVSCHKLELRLLPGPS